MKKKNDKGFTLIETLVVTIFVAGILIFLYIQFSKLSNMYQKSYTYNTVEGLYALEDVKNLIESDENAMNYIAENIDSSSYIDIKNCQLFVTDTDFCLTLLEKENIRDIFITKNIVPDNVIKGYEQEFLDFINLINEEGEETYRIVASFNNSTYATVRFGG